MKRLAVLVCLVIVGTAIGILLYLKAEKNDNQKQERRVPSAGAVMGVDKFMRNADSHGDDVVVEGVVSAVSSEGQMLALIDTKEFKECEITTCARLTLPVLWSGRMPQVKDTIRVKGNVQDSEGKSLFVASEIEIVFSPGESR